MPGDTVQQEKARERQQPPSSPPQETFYTQQRKEEAKQFVEQTKQVAESAQAPQPSPSSIVKAPDILKGPVQSWVDTTIYGQPAPRPSNIFAEQAQRVEKGSQILPPFLQRGASSGWQFMSGLARSGEDVVQAATASRMSFQPPELQALTGPYVAGRVAGELALIYGFGKLFPKTSPQPSEGIVHPPVVERITEMPESFEYEVQTKEELHMMNILKGPQEPIQPESLKFEYKLSNLEDLQRMNIMKGVQPPIETKPLQFEFVPGKTTEQLSALDLNIINIEKGPQAPITQTPLLFKQSPEELQRLAQESTSVIPKGISSSALEAHEAAVSMGIGPKTSLIDPLIELTETRPERLIPFLPTPELTARAPSRLFDVGRAAFSALLTMPKQIARPSIGATPIHETLPFTETEPMAITGANSATIAVQAQATKQVQQLKQIQLQQLQQRTRQLPRFPFEETQSRKRFKRMKPMNLGGVGRYKRQYPIMPAGQLLKKVVRKR
jgi:hypothetical protein